MISGERITASQAVTLGLVHELTIPAELDAALAKLVDALLQGGPNAIADAKRILREYQDRPLTEQALRELETDFDHRSQSPEALEGLASIREKRRPRWYSQ